MLCLFVVLDMNRLVFVLLYLCPEETVVKVLEAHFSKQLSEFLQVIAGGKVCILELGNTLFLIEDEDLLIGLDVVIIILKLFNFFRLIVFS